MFGQGNKTKAGSSKVDTLIGQQTQINGDIHFTGGLHVDGSIKGKVVAEEGSSSVLTVSEHGCIEGDVQVPNVVLNGTVTGDVRSSDRIELAARARVTGDVYYNLLEMAIGAEVNGSLVHPAEKDTSVETFDRDTPASLKTD